MAQISVEPKRGGLGWLWALIAIVIIAALVWYFAIYQRGANATGTAAPAGTTPPTSLATPAPAARLAA